MALQTDARLFGLDLSGLGPQWTQAMRGMSQWPVFNWLWPQAPVRVLMPQGVALNYLGKNKPLAHSGPHSGAAVFEVIVLPEDIVLRQQVLLPDLPSAEAQAALALAVQSQSPFAPEHLLWAARTANAAAPGVEGYEVVLTSRPLVQAHIDVIRPGLLNTAPQTPPEVWVDAPNTAPYVLPGFGEARRLQRLRLGFKVNMVLCVLALCLVAAAAATPILQLRLRALDAVAQHAKLQQEVAPVLALREGLVKDQDQLQAHFEAVSTTVSAVQALDIVTQALPDDTFLRSFALNAGGSAGALPKVVLTGSTGNAAALMQKLGSQPGLRDVKALTAATKPLGADKESFSIEATLDVGSKKQ